MAKQVEYVVEGAKVKCSQGSIETTLKATSNSRIGNQLRIIETDTTPASFDGTFGNCKRRKGEPCAMVNLPKWFNTNADFVSSSGKPCVTKDSFAVCITGAGAIRPVDSGQTLGETWLDNFLAGALDGFLEYFPNQLEELQAFLEYIKDDPVKAYIDLLKKFVGRDFVKVIAKDTADYLIAKGKTFIKAIKDNDPYTAGYIAGELGAMGVELGVTVGVAKGASTALKSAGRTVKNLKIPKGISVKFKSTPELEKHIKYIDTSVPRSRGIGGAHNSSEFFKNDVKITKRSPHPTIKGVETVEYQLPKLDKSGNPIPGEYQSRKPFIKTIYDPNIISDETFIKRGLEAANNALANSSEGVLPRVWSGVDNKGVTWRGYYENGQITSLFPE